jgi:hypothetical protein
MMTDVEEKSLKVRKDIQMLNQFNDITNKAVNLKKDIMGFSQPSTCTINGPITMKQLRWENNNKSFKSSMRKISTSSIIPHNMAKKSSLDECFKKSVLQNREKTRTLNSTFRKSFDIPDARPPSAATVKFAGPWDLHGRCMSVDA